MRIFRPADTSKRRPAWLQSHTKENFLAQIGAGVVLLVCMELRDKLEERKLDKKITRLSHDLHVA